LSAPLVGEKALSAASDVIARGGSRLHAQDVRIAAPISDPEKIICVGLNYEEHIAESDASVAKVGCCDCIADADAPVSLYRAG
jgi:2-keto-4-pentenoate hydratase/2-oxohepta-3-ene-1,7-dioic acid hydratase in catechol pathway